MASLWPRGLYVSALCSSVCRLSIYRYVGARIIGRKRRADGADQGVSSTHGHAASSAGGAGAELRRLEALYRRTAIPTHQVHDQTRHTELAYVGQLSLAVPPGYVVYRVPICLTCVQDSCSERMRSPVWSNQSLNPSHRFLYISQLSLAIPPAVSKSSTGLAHWS